MNTILTARLPAILLLACVTFTELAQPFNLRAAAPDSDPSELFKSTKLVFEDKFDGPLNTSFWEVRQNTTWTIKDRILIGAPSSKEFQARKAASADPSHAGLKPVIWLKQVPENFVCVLHMRYDAQAYQKGYPLLDLGHHTNTVVFGAKQTTLTIKKNVETIPTEQPLFALNQWHEVVIELKKGTLLLKIDGQKHVFESKNIDMAGQHQIDFKAVDGGSCQIDHVQLWEGL